MFIKSYFSKETISFDNKMIKIDGIRNTSSYGVIRRVAWKTSRPRKDNLVVRGAAPEFF